MAQRTDLESGPGVDVALRRVVLGFRVVAAVWLGLLAVVVLATGDPRPRPLIVALTVVLAGGWTAVTLGLAHRPWGGSGGRPRGPWGGSGGRPRGPGALRSWAWLAADLAVAAWTILGPARLGVTESFAGGYPFSAVALAVWARGLAGGLLAAGALSVATLGRLLAAGPSIPEAVANVVFYLATAAVLAWSIGVLRRNEERRREAEAALATERAERIRSQERAETAAHLHDSVLQTLALIQRRSADHAEVTALARRQERELRDWLQGGAGIPTAGPAATLGEALARIVEEVEHRYRLTVELVVVGDAPLDEHVEALVAATREALVNAAKHAGVERVSVYAESDAEGECRVFVRDRGVGFDPDAVDPDRQGIRESIHGRLARHGGEARIRSSPGAGTEVAIQVRAPTRP
ncbi:MAG: sensor histidine kinase [Egibacteraceae bacterium]